MDYTDEAVRLYRRWRQERATAERFRSTQILRAPVAPKVNDQHGDRHECEAHGAGNTVGFIFFGGG
jgi:hypothetical protein